jgi:hypothetical protein
MVAKICLNTYETADSDDRAFFDIFCLQTSASESRERYAWSFIQAVTVWSLNCLKAAEKVL